jgi:hypothetical protein
VHFPTSVSGGPPPQLRPCSQTVGVRTNSKPPESDEERKVVEVAKLLRSKDALGCHIEIKIGAGQENKAGDVTIKDVRRTAA